jgi:hypothetical protein
MKFSFAPPTWVDVMNGATYEPAQKKIDWEYEAMDRGTWCSLIRAISERLRRWLDTLRLRNSDC